MSISANSERLYAHEPDQGLAPIPQSSSVHNAYAGKWSLRICYALLWAVARLPFRLRLFVGKGLGRCIGRFSAKANKRVTRNISRAFPEYSHDETKGLVKRTFDHLGYSIAEFATSVFCEPQSYTHRVSVENAHHLTNAVNLGKGVILVIPNSSVLDICMHAVVSRWPVHALHARVANQQAESLLFSKRKVMAKSLIPNNDIKTMVRRLQQSEIVFYSPDCAVPRTQGGRPFWMFGLPVLTTTAPARMSQMTGAAIVCLQSSRQIDSGTYTIDFAPVLPFSSDIDRLTQGINDQFEAQIRQNPAQYQWNSERFKSPY